MIITTDKILEALSKVEDPDFKQDLVSLKMIEDVTFDGRAISFTIVLTTPACPMKDKMRKDSVEALEEQFGKDIEVHIHFTSRVTSVRDASINILPNVKNIISVVSGKGGVGKSTVAVNLAMTLAENGAKVGLIDADIHGPSVPTMLGAQGLRPQVREIKGKHYILPLEKGNLKFLSIGLLVDERQAMVWRGPMVTSALKQFITDVTWGKLDYLIFDMPPGTGDVQLSVVQTVQLTGAVVVTTPQRVALADAQKAIGMFRQPSINVPILGVVENMAYFTPPDAADKRYYIFGQDGGKALAEEYEVPLLAQIPIEEAVRTGADTGITATINENTSQAVKDAFQELASNTAQQIAIRNAQLAEAETADQN